ncbi:MAG: FAD-dependent oxidoreductase, partial [Kiritimatiellae bacterium]|nr:FAD-dependent oxidoreductase [Kiritimatiellia bacterium]
MKIPGAAILAAAAMFAAHGAETHTEATSATVAEKCIDTEVCVVGGGMAGICASVAAARNGAKVVLVQDRPMLGGNASSEIRVPVSGAYGDVLPNGKVLENREGGLIEEIRLENVYRNPACSWQVWDHVLWNFCAREPNLTVLLNTSVMECETNANHLVSVTGWDSISYTRVTVAAKIFI